MKWFASIIIGLLITAEFMNSQEYRDNPDFSWAYIICFFSVIGVRVGIELILWFLFGESEE